MKIVGAHIKITMLQLLRQPAYVVSTLIFPSLFFLFFAHPNADSLEKANFLLASFAAFAVLGVVIFQFGVHVAQDRPRPWSQFVRSLPVKGWQIVLAKSLSGLSFAIFAAWIVMVVVLVSTPAEMQAADFFSLTGVLILGALPFCLLGLCIGYWVAPNSALPVANLVYLLLSFAGGLWLPPNALPEKVKEISEFLPTRYYGEMAWATMTEHSFESSALYGSVIYALLFAGIAAWGFRRAELSNS